MTISFSASKKAYDFIAASFTRTASRCQRVSCDILEKNGGHDIKIIAKIENRQGVDNIDSIIEAADGIMIARGDMGVEIPLEDVPVIQKDIIAQVYSAGKQVITATQMLDSMIKNPTSDTCRDYRRCQCHLSGNECDHAFR